MDRYRFIGDVRGKGLLTAFEMVSDRDTMAPLPKSLNAYERFVEICYERNLITYARRTRGGVEGDHFLICPPMIVTEPQIGEILNILDDSLEEFAREAGLESLNMSRKIILTCAVTGSIHTPSMSPHLPVTPDQIATSAIEAAKAGASILHLHARDPETGRPSSDIEVFRQFLPRIKGATDAVINLTTGGSSQMTVEQRLSAPAELAPEMCSLNMGSINFGLFPMKDRYSDWKHDWEEPFLENTRDVVFKNTFHDIETVFSDAGRRRRRAVRV